MIKTDVRMRDAISWDPCGSGDEIELRHARAVHVLRQVSEVPTVLPLP